MRRGAGVGLLLVALTLIPGAQAQTRGATCGDIVFDERIDCVSTPTIAAVNAGLTAGLALVRGAVEGRIDSWRDAAEVAGAGVAAGVGFTFAKREVAQGRTVRGIGLAYATGSLLENVIEGDHPLARIRLGLGPADIRIRTGLARLPGPALAVEVDPLAAGALVVLPALGYRPDLSGGMLTYTFPDSLGALRLGEARAAASALGRVVVVRPDVTTDARGHELVHVLQSQQAGLVVPFGTLGRIWPSARRTSFGGRVSWDVRSGLGTGLGASMVLFPYAHRPLEVEAYSFEVR